ncbi:MAG: ABC transporter permease subunit [Granulosicoccus sp.]|nr:ABC transporter permease subunit [Granulosicoccus sp.]
MMGLMLKEIRQLRPIAYLWLAVLALGYTMQFFTERIDEETFSSWCQGYCDYSSNTAVVVFSVLLAMVTAYSLFPREYDDATIDFLRALPVSRPALFIAKVAAGWLLLCVVTTLSYVIDAMLLATNPESIGGIFYTQVWFTLLWRDCLFAFIVLSHGVLLSWFRTLGLVIYAIYLLILMWAENTLGSAGNWSIFSLLSNEYEGSALIANYRGLAMQTGFALFLLLVAYRLWNRTESSSAGVKHSTRGMRLVNGLFGLTGFILLGLMLAYRIGIGTGTAEGQPLKVIATDHYRFVYNAENEDVVQYIVEHAEADLQSLATILGVTVLPSIRVDLSASSDHAAGLAKWKKIQMDLESFSDNISQRRVLSHETAHVLQAIESDRALADNYSAAKFFIEGMAQYTSFQVVPENERRRSNWELASVSWQRQKIRFDDLIDSAGFAEQFDAELHYSLGDLWTKALVDTCGLSSLGDFLRATGRPEAKRDLPATIFWRDTTRAIDCDLDTVNVTWRKQMEGLYAEVDVRRYPVFSDIVIQREPGTRQTRISARLSADSSSGSALRQAATDQQGKQAFPASTVELPERFIVRIGALSTQVSSGVDPVFRGQVRGEGDDLRVEFLVPAHAIPGSRFRYQLGYSHSIDTRYYYEAWRRGTAPLVN